MYLKTAVHPYTQARVGWASNESLYDLFQTPAHEWIGYASAFSRTPRTPHVERDESDFQDGPDVQIVEADSPEIAPVYAHTNVRAFPQSHVDEPGEQSDATAEERPREYRLSEAEITSFVAAYKVSSNIDKSLAAIGRGGRYKKHASELVRVFGLRKEA